MALFFMETIRRRIKGILQDVPIYTLEEAEERGLDMVPWKDVQEGQWAITDDGYVAECLSRRTYDDNKKNGIRDYIRTTCGSFWNSNKSPFSFEERRATKTYNTHNTEPWIDRQAKTNVTRILVHAVVVMWLSNKPIDYDVLANIYSQKNTGKGAAIRYIRQILKSPRVKEMIRKEIEKELLDQGMSIKNWMELGMEILNKARQNGNLPEMRRVWKEFGEVLQVKEHESRQIPLGKGTLVLDAVSEDLKKVSTNGK